jgi:hypothetical protein
MEDNKLDIFDKYYLLREITAIMFRLHDKKRGPSNNDKMDIQIEIWRKLLWHIEEFYNMTETNHKFVFDVDSIGEVNDGSHCFDELYHHRMVLFSVICNSHKDKAWKSWLHDDGTMYDDYFIVGIDTPEGQFSYHYHKDWWSYFDVPELEQAPEWDGHCSDDVARLMSLVETNCEENKKDE